MPHRNQNFLYRTSDEGVWNKTRKKREKGRDLTQSYGKKTLHPKKNPKSNVTTQKSHQNFDYTTITDRLRSDSWSYNSHSTGVVKPVYERSTFPLTAITL